jgi:hypothetical protein
VRRFLHRFLNVCRADRTETEAAREIAAHRALLEDDYQHRGMTADEARLAARRGLGSAAYAQDLHRDARTFAWLDDARRDVAHGVRSLRRTPGFTAIAVTTLALGIGAVALSRVLEGLLFSLTPLDLTTFGAVVVVFAGVAMLASYVPARRATRVDPLVALRTE